MDGDGTAKKMDQISSKDAMATLQRGVAAHQQGSLQEARACYLKVLRFDAANADVLHLLGTVEAQYGRLNNAERVLRRALGAGKPRAEHAITLGRVLEQKGAADEALELYTTALEQDPRALEAWHRRGLLRKRRGELKQAEADLREAVALQPAAARLLNDLGTVLKLLGRRHDAAASFEHAIRAQPDYAYAHNNLGVGYLEDGQLRQAARCFENALLHRPEMATAHDNLGLVQRETGNLEEALKSHEAAIKAAPHFVDAVVHRAAVLQVMGRHEEAETGFRQALKEAPGHAGALAGLAELYEWRGEYQEGLALIEDAALQPGSQPELRIAAARLMRRVYRSVQALEMLTPLARDDENAPPMSTARQRELNFTLGHLYDQEAQYDLAFEHFRQGNRLHSSGFDPDRWRNHIDAMIEQYSRVAIEQMPGADAVGDLIFIVGMPRSGTSLVEQILSAHSGVHAAGERPDVGLLANGLCRRLGTADIYPRCVPAVTSEALNVMAAEYRATLGDVPSDALRITDKMPLNFLHLGLIEMLFPQARIVHCVRDPLDTALSCFFQDFVDPALDFATHLHYIVSYYRQYRRLMAHWKSVCRLPIMDLRYEKLVLDQESATRNLLEHVGLPFQPRCLKFHEQNREVHTASHAQVRQPIYRTSIGRHMNYEQFLKPFRDDLSQ